MASTRQQINFEHWANMQSFAAIKAAQLPVPEALAILAHSVAISNFWAARAEATKEDGELWPTLSKTYLESGLLRLKDRWLKLAGKTALDTEIRYLNREGVESSNRFDKILQEVLLHGGASQRPDSVHTALKGLRSAKIDGLHTRPPAPGILKPATAHNKAKADAEPQKPKVSVPE